MSALANAEFDYHETTDIRRASELDLGCSGIYTDATIIYFEIKNLTYLLKEIGRRKTAQAYTMYFEVLYKLAEETSGVLNCFSPSAFLIIYPGKEDAIKKAVTGSLKIVYALTETYKKHFSDISNLEFAMGIDHGHIMGTKVMSDYGTENISWFGSCIYKAIRICRECARPFYVGVSGSVYHSLDESLRTTTRRILGIKKSVDMWTKVTYQYENVKKHLYQSNHKIPLEEA
mgnify:FL=1